MSTANRRKTGPKRKNAGLPPSRLQSFLDVEGITSARLEAETGISRQSMTKIRAGRDVRRKTMLRILTGVRNLTRRDVGIEELFDLDPNGSTKSPAT